MTLEIALRHRLGAFSLDLAFSSEAGVIALFGPSGSGKTSVVNAIAGLLRPDSGRVVVEGTTLVDTKAGLFVPPHKRRVGLVFQDARLFPHLTVRQNLVFGRWFTPRAERTGDLDHVVSLLGIGHLLKRRPAGLSGGERQRVAIGRALLASPRLLVLDEPLASLDEARKQEILPYLERLRDEAGVPIVYVSHSREEVARLAGEVVLLEEGRIVGRGTPGEVLRAPSLPPPERGPERARRLARWA
jgi:molybdate transport system ATP-binding protein